jgi:hypothetical protein
VITPVAHTGHWLANFAYLAPLLFLVGVIGWGKLKDRRARRHGSAT